MYQHRDVTGNTINLPVGKIVCVGRNYVDHIHELDNPMPDEPVLFIKPSTCAIDFAQPAILPQGQGECHNEVELAVLLNKPLKNATKQQAMESIWGVGIGLDLTLRDVQTKMKTQGLPWERAKAFDNACPLTGFVPMDNVESLDALQFELKVNEQLRQSGHCQHMIWKTLDLLVEISQPFHLVTRGCGDDRHTQRCRCAIF